MAHLFREKRHAEMYATFRPRQRRSLYEAIIAYCKGADPRLQLAVDLACGTGLNTVPLTEHFDHVIGVDISEAQIDQARKEDIADVEFRVGAAEDLPFLADGSADLVTCGNCLHWMDLERVYAEVRRVLRPRGAFVVYGYHGLLELNSATANQHLLKFRTETLKDWWGEERQLVSQLEKGLFQLPFEDTRSDTSHVIEGDMGVAEIVGYLSSWSAWQKFIKAHPNSQEMRLLEERLKEAFTQDKLGTQDEVAHFKFTFPNYLIMGRT